MSEHDAIDRLKQGDIGGLETLVRRYQLRAVRAADLITRDRALAEDVVQEAFLRVYQHIDQFDSNRPFEPWFLRIVINNALKAVSKNDRWRPLENLHGDRVEYHLSNEALQPEKWLVGEERREQVWEALGELPPEQRGVIVLKYFLGLSIDEIGGEMVSPSGTIKWRLHRARKRLRELLKALERNENKKTEGQSGDLSEGNTVNISESEGAIEEMDGNR